MQKQNQSFKLTKTKPKQIIKYLKMQINQISQSAKIYLDQINIYIQKGEGYQQLRVHLLKQLNETDAENPNADDTLAPALFQNLRKRLTIDSAQFTSRAIDVLEDLIKYADQIVESYICSNSFCMHISVFISFKNFNPFNRNIVDENRLRLGSIILYYYDKFQSDQYRYMNIFKTFKQLKQKNCSFPPKTFISIPKHNQFKRIKKSQSQKISESDRIGVTFDSIVQFVKQCQTQFNSNKNSCANTQFVRALKVKAKTIFDLTQNNQGIELNSKEKEQAKVLYKQIRTMLKQIQKISEEKIKQQKIKSEKQFALQKIEQISPNKKKQPSLHGSEKGSVKQNKDSQSNSKNLIDDQQTQDKTITLKTPTKIKKPSLLDEQPQIQFTQYIQEGPQFSKQKSSNQKEGKTSIKAIKSPPKFQNLLGDTHDQQELIQINSKITPKKVTQDAQLIQTIQKKASFSKKSIKSIGGHSIHSEESDTKIKRQESLKGNCQAKGPVNQNILDFDNDKHFSKFEIVNKFIDPNTYNVIPDDIDFSDGSSSLSEQGNRVTFQMNKNNNIFGEQSVPYDKTFTPKKQNSFQQKDNQHSQKQLEKLSLSAKVGKTQPQELIANHNFGILADVREVKAYDYGNIKNLSGQKSSIGGNSEEQKQLRLTPQSNKHNNKALSMKKIVSANSISSMNDASPSNMSFNSGKKKNKNALVDGNDEDEEFQDYQEVDQTPSGFFNNPLFTIDLSMKNEPKIHTQTTPQKQDLLPENQEMAAKNNQVFL